MIYEFSLNFSCYVLTLLIWFSEETNKRKVVRSKSSRDAEKGLYSPKQGRSFNCKYPTLKLVLGIIILGAFLTLLHTPAIYDTEHTSKSAPRYATSGISLVWSQLLSFLIFTKLNLCSFCET